MASRPYFPYVPRRAVNTTSDFERGMQAGGQIGKLLGTFGDAIRQQKQNAVANQLMDQAGIANQPGAGVIQDLGGLPADTGDGGDNWTLPDTTGPVQGGGDDTVGGLIHTGGVDEMKLRQEAAKEALSQQNIQAEIAKNKAAASLATLRGGLVTQGGLQPQPGDASAWSGYQLGGGVNRQPSGRTSSTKTAPEEPVVIGSEPVTNQNQLVTHFDGTYGKGSFARTMSSIASAKPEDIYKEGDNFITVGGDKPIQIPLSDAKAYVKQLNALRIKQGLPAFQVPGENASLGTSMTNPYPTQNNLDVWSRPPGSWVTLPNGKIAQVPGR